MSEISEVQRAWRGIVRRWPVVLALTVVGALLVMGMGSLRPESESFVSKSTVRIGIASLPNMPNPAAIVAYAGSADAKKSVEASRGLDPSGVSISVAADAKEAQAVHITVRARDAETAEQWADALAESSRAYGLSKIGWMIELETNKAERLARRLSYFDERSARMRSLANAATNPEIKYNYDKAAQDLELQRMTTEDLLDQSRLTRQGYLSYVTVSPASSAAKVSASPVLLSNVLRGAIVGLFAGALVAALLDRRRSA